MDRLGLNLKKLRELHNITQEQLAEHLGVTRPTIAGYETKDKQPDYEKLIKLSKFFNVSVDYLIGNNFNFNESGQDIIEVDRHLEQFINALEASNELVYQEKLMDIQVKNILIDMLNHTKRVIEDVNAIKK